MAQQKKIRHMKKKRNTKRDKKVGKKNKIRYYINYTIRNK